MIFPNSLHASDDPGGLGAKTRMASRLDPFGHRGRLTLLRAAIQKYRPADPEFAALAYYIAIAAGHCVLTASPMFGNTTRLSPSVAVASLRYLRELLPCWRATVAKLPVEYDEAPSPDEADKRAYRWIVVRTDVWALLEAVRLTEVKLQDGGRPEAEDVSTELDATFPHFECFDRELETCKSVLATQCYRSTVASLRDTLADEYRNPLPWWLDPNSFSGLVADRPAYRMSS